MDFDYISAKSTPEAIQWLASHQGKVKIMAGGTDLLVQLQLRENVCIIKKEDNNE